MTVDETAIGFGLHDAKLDQVLIDWSRGRGTIVLHASVPRLQGVSIEVQGLIDVRLPRRHPWGIAPHAFTVNDVKETRSADGRETQVDLEMSSGDVLSFVAEHFLRVNETARPESDPPG